MIAPKILIPLYSEVVIVTQKQNDAITLASPVDLPKHTHCMQELQEAWPQAKLLHYAQWGNDWSEH
jgi:hypothetical protein